MNKELISQLLLIFVLTQGIGLIAGDFLISQNIHTTLVTDNPEDIENGVGLIVWIIGFTAILLILMKFSPDWLLSILLKGIESMAIFGTSIIVLMPTFLSDEIILSMAIVFVALRIIFKEHVLLRNASSIVAAAGAGALIGASLGVIPVLVFIVLLGIYDYIAVFKTKHMVTLAKGVTKKNLSFTYALPTKEHNFELGTGDMVIPLAFAISVLSAQTNTTLLKFFPSIAILIASLIGLVLTLDYASKNKGKPLPALPLQTALMVLVFGITKLVGF
ncbi:MAG: presenilin family intramembrane aspartyl protease [archaeon]|nr:presenilin family intramembrane aspartyl protease [archaeon]